MQTQDEELHDLAHAFELLLGEDSDDRFPLISSSFQILISYNPMEITDETLKHLTPKMIEHKNFTFVLR